MTAISWQNALILSSLVARKIYGDNVVACDVPVALAIWPCVTTGGPRAAAVCITPLADVHIAIDATPNTIGQDSARLIKDTEYVFPLNPEANTISFIDAQSTSCNVRVKWIIV